MRASILARNRYSLAVGPAALVTLSIFWLMNSLISNGMPALVEDTPLPAIVILRTIEDTTAMLEPPSLPDKPDEIPPPQIPRPDLIETSKENPSGIPWSRPEQKATFEPMGRGSNALEGAPIPLVRQPPIYPARPAQRGIEGWVRLSFDITPTGSVDNIRIVDEKPMNTFGRAATKALSRWRYKPEVKSGRPIRRTDVEIVITFNLDQE